MITFNLWLSVSVLFINIHHIYGSAIIGNGQIIVGVDDFGQLNTDYVGGVLGLPDDDPLSINNVGLRNGNGRIGLFSATEAGCLCEGWGVALVNNDGNVQVWANNARGGQHGTLVRFVGENGGDSATSTVRDTTGSVQVIHDFKPSASIYATKVDVTIRNIGTENYDRTLYRRVMDWDIHPTPFREYVTIIGTNASNLILSNDNGFCYPSPLTECIERESGTTNVDFIDNGPADHGANFDFDFGPLAAGERISFTIFYGVAPGEDLAYQALNENEAQVASLGQNSNRDPTEGLPYTFFWGFGGVGGRTIQSPCPTFRYVHDGVARTYDEAQQYCVDTYGTSLASIRTQTHLNCLCQLVQNREQPWIGLYSEPDDVSFFTFMDGSSCDDTIPNGLWSGACVNPDFWQNGKPLELCDEEGGTQCTKLNDQCKLINDRRCDNTLRALVCNAPETTSGSNDGSNNARSEAAKKMDDFENLLFGKQMDEDKLTKIEAIVIAVFVAIFVLVSNLILCYCCYCRDNEEKQSSYQKVIVY